jgi:3-deoxy-manno-octulosonate cytidylyltransferase (CMP-KDO synthetase)
MKVYAIIPARYNSSRFPGKPLALINGIPMWQWVYKACDTCSKVDKVFLTTDDNRIVDSAISAHANVILTGDCPSGSDRVHEAAKGCGLSGDDLVINVQGDEPLVSPWHLELLIDYMHDNPRSRIVTLATPIDYQQAIDPNIVKVVKDHDNRAMYFSRIPIPYNSIRYLKHIGIYAYRMATLGLLCALPPAAIERAEQLEQLRALDHGIGIYVCTTTHDTIAVDVPGDIARVEAHLNSTKI